MTNYDTRPYNREAIDNNNPDLAGGQDSIDSSTTDETKTAIGSGDSSFTEKDQSVVSSDPAPDQTVYRASTTYQVGQRPVHLTEDCRYLQEANDYRGIDYRHVSDHDLCKHCTGDVDRYHGNDETFECDHCEREFESQGGRSRHVLQEHPDAVPVGDDQEVMTDGGQVVESTAEESPAARGLTLFKLEILYTLGEDASDNKHGVWHGLAIKAELADVYQTDIKHGRLYPSLNDLVERGLVAKTSHDRRTNAYALTDAGKRLLRRDAQRRVTVAKASGGDD